MRRPDLTLIVSTFNRPEWLAVSLGSILTSAAFAELHGITTEVLVVDDGSSTNAAADVAARLGVGYIRKQVNDGLRCPSAARVLGLERVDSPYVAFFDDDDVMLPRWIPLHVAALEAGHDVCSTSFLVTDADLVPTRRVVPLPATMGDLLVGRVSVNDQSLMRTQVAQEVDWDPSLENVMVYAAWMELMFRGRSFHRLEEPTFLYRRHEQNISDRIGPDDLERRLDLQQRYRKLVLARDGALPRPTSVMRRAMMRVKSAAHR